MKQTFLNIIGFAFYIYVMSMTFAAPYYNWQYAKENGFVNWLFFGEVVATAKSLIWPYYAVVGFSSEQAHHTDLHFANSRRASTEALNLVNRFDGGLADLPSKDASDVARLLEASVTEAELVDDSYLKQVHPEFLRRFRDEYTGSLRDLADGVRTSDVAKQIAAATAYNSFSEWVKTHAKELKFP
jgi:hypothetical protein